MDPLLRAMDSVIPPSSYGIGERSCLEQRVRDGGFGYGGDGHFDVSANSTTYSGCYGSKDAMIDGCHVTYYGLHENVKENQEFILLE